MRAKNKYVHHVTGKERKLLKKIYKKGIGRISQRAHIILVITTLCPVYTVIQVAKLCFCCRKTVYNVIARFNEEGIVGLIDKQRTGRPRKIQASKSDEILETLENKKPCEVNSKFVHCKWTLKLIQKYIEQNWKIYASQKTISRWLHLNGWSYNRSKRELTSPDPIDEQEQQEVIELLQEIDHTNEVVVFLDQSAFYLAGLPSGAWMPKDKQKPIYVSGGKQKFWIFGAFNPHTKKVYYRICNGCNSFEMVLFLRQLRQRYPGKTIHVVLDNASFHSSAETDYYLYHNPGFVFHFTPKGGAKLNPIERFWLFAKGVTVASSIFTTLEELYHALRRFFWHYNEGNLEYNFNIDKTIEVWKRWPSVSRA